ncbi:2-polyprenyl-6-methoxyphenol hydroxylase-like oxidoreductase [Cylindrospermum stagnale PCC 7417]|uniref:2-polyprenyl-6-methoxyphenol hydroxylase-like oxidoreductase n=1 Tax=Cylindrospermum stagnale PCC 7417 TaxID=56107 RepID=K9X341_9NOST|nr:tryptophan 7-halogenase [Cylindrospermum stagnale]AFZ26486.1 2-polyprenyl-6-methoxyphenol hydroxylase-like oxidoreductase [Cylindrospermum stagnale PCC 7417]
MAEFIDIIPNVPRINPNAHLIVGAAGEVYSWVGSDVFVLEGIQPASIRDLLALIDGVRPLEAICAELADGYNLDHLHEIILALSKVQIIQEAPLTEAAPENDGWEPPAAPEQIRQKAMGYAPQKAIALLGNHQLLDTLDKTFAAAGFQHRQTFRLNNFESCQTPEFLALQQARILCPPPTADIESLDSVNVSWLSQLFKEFDFVICALEGVPFQALFDVNKSALASGTPCLFVTASQETALIGPTVIRGATACFGCRVITLETVPSVFGEILPQLSTPMIGVDSPILANVARECLEEAISILGSTLTATRATSVLQITPQGRTVKRLLPSGECHECAPRLDAPLGVLERKAIASAAEEISRIWPLSPQSTTPPAADAYQTVGILGGGTAGYLTALAFRALRPDIKVTLIESSAIPVIGVGEATTPELVKFLHSPRFLGLDIVDFYQRVRPTWKLGIKFQWGLPDDYEFTFPFQRGRLLESHLYESTLNNQSLGAMLMSGDRIPVFDQGDGTPLSLLHQVRWAYHLDNRRFIRYLKEEAIAAGINHLDVKISDAQMSADGENITHLITEDGRQLAYDLYIDCSGFRSFLLEQKLGSKFVSYAGTLGTDHAIAATVPHNGTIKPYTLAETMNNGWCWNIPFEDADHRGYVFSSAFCSDEQAVAEMRAKNPGMSEPSLIKFRSGRHEHFWKGNVVAIGNSYAFVEPLESTAIHMIVQELELLLTHFPASKRDQAVKSVLNRKINHRWDSLRWFLGIHYKFNHRLSTPFWQAVNRDTDISGAAERVALFQERAPLSYQNSMFYTLHPPEFFSDDHSYDTLLFGQQIPARFVEPVEDAATWQRQLAILKGLTSTAMPQHQALTCLRDKRPDLLYDFAKRRDSWLHTWLPA